MPCPALDRQAGEQCTFPLLLGTVHVLEDSHIPCKCSDPPSPGPKSTIVSRHREGLFLPSQILLSHHAGNEHPFHHGGQARGEALPRALAQYSASAWISLAPEAVPACRAHRNLPCPIRTSPQALRTRTCAALPEGITPALPEGLRQGSGMTTEQTIV